MEWKIRPLIGVESLEFSMSPDQVADILGNGIKFRRAIEDGSMNEYRDSKFPVCNYLHNRLRCVDLYSVSEHVTLEGIDIFDENPQRIINHLEESSGPPSIRFGICYFKSIGISLGKWIDERFDVKAKPSRDKDLRSISVSSKGAHFDIFTDDKIVSLRKPLR